MGSVCLLLHAGMAGAQGGIAGRDIGTVVAAASANRAQAIVGGDLHRELAAQLFRLGLMHDPGDTPAQPYSF